MNGHIGDTTACSFCGAAEGPVWEQAGQAICDTCVEKARAAFDRMDSSPLTRFDLAWGGHEGSEACRLTLTGSQLGRVVETFTAAGIAAGVQCLPSDQRLRAAADFNPDPDRVVPAERVQASLDVQLGEAAMGVMVRRLGEVQLREVRHFLSLASFHGGYTVRSLGPVESAS